MNELDGLLMDSIFYIKVRNLKEVFNLKIFFLKLIFTVVLENFNSKNRVRICKNSFVFIELYCFFLSRLFLIIL